MATTSLLAQPFSGCHGNAIVAALQSGEYRTLKMAVAFARTSGIRELELALRSFRAAGGMVEAYVGIDLMGTTYEALAALLESTDALYVVHAESSQTYHPKLYSLTSETSGLLLVGSANLTHSGLFSNAECSAVVSLSLDMQADRDMQEQVDGFFARLSDPNEPCSKAITKTGDIDELAASGYLPRESDLAEGTGQMAAEPHDGLGGHAFGNRIQPSLPKTLRPLDGGMGNDVIRVGDGRRYKDNRDVCNAVFGSCFKGIKQGGFFRPKTFVGTGYEEWRAWFPLVQIDGLTEKSELKTGWRNYYDEATGLIREVPLTEKSRCAGAGGPKHGLTRVVFAKRLDESEPYEFVGVYRYGGVDDSGAYVYERVSEEFACLPRADATSGR